MALETFNPTTGERLHSYPEHTDSEVEERIMRAQTAQESWQRIRFAERSGRMRALGKSLRERKAELARLAALEMGKPLAQGEGEVEKCAWACDYFAEHAEAQLATESIQTGVTASLVVFKPVGIILAVMPWNFPFWQVFRAAVPALMAGNGMVLKHSSNVSGCALAIEELFSRAGLPAHLFSTLLLSSKRVPAVIRHPSIQGVTLTGSTEAGKAVAACAGGLLKKTVLELGGSDPYIVLADADLATAAASCATSRMLNAGQSCISAKRLIVVDSVRAEFEELFLQQMRSQKMGDPLIAGTTLGPLARPDLRDALQSQVDRSVAAGARLTLGGAIPEGPGAFYPPTVLTEVTPEMPAFHEETFGPVAAITGVADDKEAIRLANNTSFGLGAAIFTRDEKRGQQIASEELEAGCCFVNDFVKSDPRLPFGGIKGSGYGRELSSFGLREFVNIKTVVVK